MESSDILGRANWTKRNGQKDGATRESKRYSKMRQRVRNEVI